MTVRTVKNATTLEKNPPVPEGVPNYCAGGIERRDVRRQTLETNNAGAAVAETVMLDSTDYEAGGAAIGGNLATTATAGTPGTFDGTVPYNLDQLNDVTASPATAWTTGQSVTLGDGTSAYWDGTAWQAGTAP